MNSVFCRSRVTRVSNLQGTRELGGVREFGLLQSFATALPVSSHLSEVRARVSSEEEPPESLQDQRSVDAMSQRVALLGCEFQGEYKGNSFKIIKPE